MKRCRAILITPQVINDGDYLVVSRQRKLPTHFFGSLRYSKGEGYLQMSSFEFAVEVVLIFLFFGSDKGQQKIVSCAAIQA